MSQTLHKIALVLLIISLWMESIEISFLMSLLVLFVSIRSRISSDVVRFAGILFLFVIVGVFGIFKDNDGIYAYVKDVVYFLRPITILFAAYFSVMRFKNRGDFLDILVISGFVFAFLHLAYFAVRFNVIHSDVSNLRLVFGRLNHVEMVALFLVICVKDIPIKRTRYKIVYQFFVACLALSFVLYFSRTMFLVVALMSVAYWGYLKLNPRGVIALVFLGIAGAGFLYFLSKYDPPNPEDAGLVDTFLIKIKNSYTEAFETVDFDRTVFDYRELWAHWRAYEANLVIDEVNKDRVWLAGKGFGSTVDVGFEIVLGGERIRNLPTVHNGLAYVYMKTGLFGLVIYAFAFIFIYRYYFKREDDERNKKYNRLMAAVSFYILVSSFVVTGFYKPYDMSTLLIGGIMALKHQMYLENRNIRDEGHTE